MSTLSDFEDRVGRAIEGVFADVFRSPVQPAELARAAAKEMDRSRKLGVGKVYAPTMYSVLLSPEDAEQLGGFTHTLAGELETYLRGYAHDRDYELTSRPRVRFLVDDELKLGRYDVIGEILSAKQIAEELGEVPDAPEVAVAPKDDSQTFADDDDADEAAPAHPHPPVPATVTVVGVAHDMALTGDRVVIGRLSTCGVYLQDANVSREHAVFVRDGSGWAIVDMGSTNGTLVNGARVSKQRLDDGDRIVVGVTELVFNEPRG